MGLPTEEETLIAQTARGFARSIGLERAAEQDRHDTFPAEALREAAGLGFLALAQAGSGLPPATLAIVLDEVAQVDPNTAACLAAHNACLRLARSHAGDLAARLAGGELASLLASEEAHGSDLGAIGTVARALGDGWRITGQKVWAANAEGAEHLLVLASIPGPKPQPTLFHVPAKAPGVTLGQGESLLGLRASGVRTVYLYDVAVGRGDLIGEPGEGLVHLAAAMAWLRVGVAASLNGCVAGALAAAAGFAQTRVQFQAPIGTYQAVSDGLTAIDVQLAASRSLTADAAARLETPEAPLWAARAKAFASEMAIPMTRQAIRVQGGTGFMREGGTERFARDARALQFVGGPIQMQKDTVKRALMPDITFPAAP